MRNENNNSKREVKIGAPKSELVDNEFKKRGEDFIKKNQNNKHLDKILLNEPILPNIITTDNEPKKVTKDLLVLIKKILEKKQGAEVVIDYLDRLTLQQQQHNKFTLAQVVEEFIKICDRETLQKALIEVHKRASSSAQLINNCLLGKLDLIIDGDQISIDEDGKSNKKGVRKINLATEYPEINSKIQDAQPNMLLMMEEYHAEILLDEFITQVSRERKANLNSLSSADSQKNIPLDHELTSEILEKKLSKPINPLLLKDSSNNNSGDEQSPTSSPRILNRLKSMSFKKPSPETSTKEKTIELARKQSMVGRGSPTSPMPVATEKEIQEARKRSNSQAPAVSSYKSSFYKTSEIESKKKDETRSVLDKLKSFTMKK